MIDNSDSEHQDENHISNDDLSSDSDGEVPDT